MKKSTNLSIVEICILSLFFVIIIPFQHSVQAQNNDIVLGKRITLNSNVLDEERNILVYTPMGYNRTKEKYPVIYILDGGANFAFSSAIVNFLSRSQRMPQSIVVGILNTDRMRDFSPVYEEGSPTSGGADKFLEFMKSELLSYIEKNYRTQPYKILFGHSLCGMFSVYTLFEKPEIFDAYIAVSPYLQYADQYVIDKVESALSKRKDLEKHLFITLGNEPTYIESINRIEKLFSDKTEKLTWEISKRESEDHISVPLKSLYDGLEFIFSDWRLTNKKIKQGFQLVKEHYSILSKKYNFEVRPSEATINAIGYWYLRNEDSENAIESFKFNTNQFPSSANVYDSLGDALERIGHNVEAAENYKTAVKFGGMVNDPNLKIYKENLRRVEELK